MAIATRYGAGGTTDAPASRPESWTAVRDKGVEGKGIVRLIDWLLDGMDRARQRHALGRLDDHLLKDIGLTRADVHREYDKPFWRG